MSPIFATQPDVTTPPKLLTGDTEAAKIGVLPLKEVDLALLFRKPPENPPSLLSAKEVIAKSTPGEASSAIAIKEREMETAKLILTHTPEDCPLHATNLEYFKTTEAALAKLKRQLPCPKVVAAQLAAAQQAQVAQMHRFQEKVEAGQAKAAERLAEQLGAIDALAVALHERRTACISEHGKAVNLWNAYNQRRRNQHQEVVSQFEGMILAANLPDTSDPMVTDSSLQVLDADVVPTPTEDALLLAQKNAAVAYEALAKLQKRFAEAQQVPPQPIVPPELVTFNFEDSDLPVNIPEPEPDQWDAFHTLYAALDALGRHDLVGGAPVPVTYGEINCGLTVPRLLLGDTLWAKAYPQGNVDDSTIVSQQVRGMMVLSIKQHLDKLLKDKAKHDAHTAAAKASMGVLAADHRDKKRKSVAASAAGA